MYAKDYDDTKLGRNIVKEVKTQPFNVPETDCLKTW